MRAVQYEYTAWGALLDARLGTVVDSSDTAWNNFALAYQRSNGFDSNGRVIRQTLWDGTTNYAVSDILYDADGRPFCTVQYMDPNQWWTQATSCAPFQTNGPFGPDRISQTIYDAAGQPTQLKVAAGTADEAVERTVTYNNNGALNTLTDGENNKTTILNDGFDRPGVIQHPSTTKGSGTSNPNDNEQFAYDPNGNVIAYRNRAGALFTYSYDNLDRMTVKIVPEVASVPADRTRDVYYGYDNLGRMTFARFDSASGEGITESYDALSRQLSETGPITTISQQFDLAGDRTQLSTSGSVFLNYERLTTGEIKTIRDANNTALGSFTYDDLRRRTGLSFGDGSSDSWSYDAVSRVASFTRDFSGTANDLTVTFAYNPASQIVSETRSNDAYAFTGNVNGSTSYTSNGLNQIASAGGIAFTHDANGNVTGDGVASYLYDMENRLAASSAPGPAGSQLYYDPLGRLYQVSSASDTRRYVYTSDDSGMPQPVLEYDGSGNLLAHYGPGAGPDEPLFWWDYPAGKFRSLHADERGSIIALSDGASASPVINTYDEHGKPGASNLGRFQYTGQMWLPEIGLQYSKARAYSPALGRFMQTDPMGPADDANLYQYALNDPMNNVDPTGLDCVPGNDVGTEGDDCSDILVTRRRHDSINVTASIVSFPFFLLIPNVSLGVSSLSLGASGSDGNQQCAASGLLAPPAAIAGEAAAAAVAAIPSLGLAALLALLPGSDTRRASPQYVVRGGVTTAQSLISGSRFNAQYGVSGFSVNTAPGMSVDQIALAAPVPNAMISYTTTAQLAGVGVPVVPTPTSNTLHATAVVPVPLDPARAAVISHVFQQTANPARCTERTIKMNRVFFDSNTGNEQEGYVLDFEQSKLDIKKMGSRARDGTVILLYMPDELEVKAEMRFDPALDCWRGFPKGEFKVL